MRTVEWVDDKGKAQSGQMYTAVVRVAVEGVGSHTATGTGEVRGSGLEAHARAIKSAEVNALKRGLRCYGPAFGLGLGGPQETKRRNGQRPPGGEGGRAGEAGRGATGGQGCGAGEQRRADAQVGGAGAGRLRRRVGGEAAGDRRLCDGWGQAALVERGGGQDYQGPRGACERAEDAGGRGWQAR